MAKKQEPTLGDVLSEMRQRFDGVEDRLHGIDVRFDGIDGRLDVVDTRFDEVDARLTAHSESLAWLKMNSGMVAQAVAGIAAGVEQCKMELATRDRRLSKVESTLERLAQEVDLPEDPHS